MPASGKDTITLALTQKYPQFIHFKKHKSGNAPLKASYNHVTQEEFFQEVKEGNFLQYNERYGNYYGIHKSYLKNVLESGKIPVIHFGKPSGFYKFREKLIQWNPQVDIINILLWEEMVVLEQRLKQRETSKLDYEKRVLAAKEEFQEFYLEENKQSIDYYLKNKDVDKTCETIHDLTYGKTSETGRLLFESYLNSQL